MKDSFANEKIFVGISNVLMWTRTVGDPDEPETPYNESDYKKRRSHLDFRPQINTEREIMRFGKDDKLRTYIICAGLIQHGGDSIFHSMFKVSVVIYS